MLTIYDEMFNKSHHSLKGRDPGGNIANLRNEMLWFTRFDKFNINVNVGFVWPMKNLPKSLGQAILVWRCSVKQKIAHNDTSDSLLPVPNGGTVELCLCLL